MSLAFQSAEAELERIQFTATAITFFKQNFARPAKEKITAHKNTFALARLKSGNNTRKCIMYRVKLSRTIRNGSNAKIKELFAV
jgi:hypothetical protein